MDNDGLQLLDNLVRETRLILQKTILAEQMPASLTKTFAGYCGLAQCIAGYALQDLSIPVRPVATQSLPDFWHGHAILTATINERLFLIDPTFAQFCEADTMYETPSPRAILSRTPEGNTMLELLLGRGYLALTPERAGLYLASLCKGRNPLNGDADAYSFLERPPHHPYHFHHEPDDDMFDRKVLARNGLLIAPTRAPLSTGPR